VASTVCGGSRLDNSIVVSAHPADDPFQVGNVRGDHAQDRVRPAGDGVGPHDLAQRAQVAAHRRERHRAVRVELDDGGELPAEHLRVDHRGEAPDDVPVHQPVDPPLGRRHRQAYRLGQIGVRGASVPHQQCHQPPVDVVHTADRCVSNRFDAKKHCCVTG
jgi:hypothetical protein